MRVLLIRPVNMSGSRQNKMLEYIYQKYPVFTIEGEVIEKILKLKNREVSLVYN